jgi:hypothetical protein
MSANEPLMKHRKDQRIYDDTCEGLGAKCPGATRRAELTRVPTATVTGNAGDRLPMFLGSFLHLQNASDEIHCFLNPEDPV